LASKALYKALNSQGPSADEKGRITEVDPRKSWSSVLGVTYRDGDQDNRTVLEQRGQSDVIFIASSVVNRAHCQRALTWPTLGFGH
jgi:hypothetical protein